MYLHLEDSCDSSSDFWPRLKIGPTPDITSFTWAYKIIVKTSKNLFIPTVMLRRPLFQAWLVPNLDTIPNNCVGENSL